MLFEFNHYSALLLIFFVHGLVYALLLWRRAIRQERQADHWLALFLLLCILYITPWMVGFAGWYDNQPYRDILFYVPFQQLLLIGPVVFFYTQSLLNPAFRVDGKAVWHLVPAVLYLVFCLVMVVTDKLVLGRPYFMAGGQDPDFDTWYQSLGFVSMFTYLLMSFRYYRLFRRIMVQVIAYADRVQFPWMQNFLLAFLVMLSLRLLFFGLSFFIPYDYSNSWWYYLAFALVFYYVAISGYGNVLETKVSFGATLVKGKAALLLSQPAVQQASDAEYIDLEPAPRYNPEQDQVVAGWMPRIKTAMTEERLYENPELSLSDLARRLQLPAAQLSKIINQGTGCNFNDFINGYRVAAVKAKLAAGEQQSQTLLGIAYDCGFNSKATFNRAFRKATGVSPSDYLRHSGPDNQAAATI